MKNRPFLKILLIFIATGLNLRCTANKSTPSKSDNSHSRFSNDKTDNSAENENINYQLNNASNGSTSFNENSQKILYGTWSQSCIDHIIQKSYMKIKMIFSPPNLVNIEGAIYKDPQCSDLINVEQYGSGTFNLGEVMPDNENPNEFIRNYDMSLFFSLGGPPSTNYGLARIIHDGRELHLSSNVSDPTLRPKNFPREFSEWSSFTKESDDYHLGDRALIRSRYIHLKPLSNQGLNPQLIIR